MTTKMGLHTFDKPMSKEQAKRYGDRHMPSDLRAAGFKTVIFTADPEINGWLGYRINYGMRIGHPRGYDGKFLLA